MGTADVQQKHIVYFVPFIYLLYVLGTRGGGLGTDYSQLCMIMLKLSPEYLVLKSVIELSGKIETVISSK